MTLAAFLTEELARPVDPKVRALATLLAEEVGAAAVLFYGSNLRSGALDGVLDFYVLRPGPPDRGMWPTVSYRERTIDGELLRAKIATMQLATFARAAADGTIDTTIWTRFVQPAALVWARDAASGRLVVDAIGRAAITASRYAAALGPGSGAPAAFWKALFAATYAAELRVERGRPDSLLDRDHHYFTALLPLAWAAGGLRFERHGEAMRPILSVAARVRLRLAWAARRAAGKPINVARLIRATTTFTGAARYAAWKIERHTGVAVELTPWQERHPVLASPLVLWRVRRQRAR